MGEQGPNKPAIPPPPASGARLSASDLAARVAFQMPAMLAYWDADERCQYANESYLAWFGRTAEEMRGIRMSDLLGRLYELNKPYISKALQGIPQEFERRIPLPNGGFRDSLATYTPDIADGVVRGFVAHVTDVTGLKERLHRLRESDERVRQLAAEHANVERLKTLMTKVGVGMVVQGKHAEILLCNRAALELLDLTEDQLLGRSSFDAAWNVVHEDGSPFLPESRPVPRVLATGKPATGVIMGVFRPTRGDRVWLLVNAEPELSPSGEVIEVTTTFVDLTERLRLQERLLHAQKMESLVRLAGGIAHDFNNLLTIISTAASNALHQSDLPESLREDMVEVQKAGERAARLTSQLLSYSRRQVLTPTTLDVSKLVNGLREMVRRLVRENIHVDIELPSEPCFARIDRAQLEQLVLTLAANANDAMTNGGTLTITIKAAEAAPADILAKSDGEHDLAGRPVVLLQVTDTGAGMDTLTRRHIFDPFFRSEGARTSTGLGLATAYGVVRQSGGVIVVDSTVGRGTTFTVCLPCVTPVSEPAATSATILVVEDEDGVRRMLTKILRAARYDVLEAESGEAALELLSTYAGPLDLVVSDVVMPGMNGRELLTRILEARPDVSTLLTSGYNEDDLLKKEIEEGMNFLAKPYSRTSMVEKVQAILAARPARSSAGT